MDNLQIPKRYSMICNFEFKQLEVGSWFIIQQGDTYNTDSYKNSVLYKVSDSEFIQFKANKGLNGLIRHLIPSQLVGCNQLLEV